MKRILTLLLCLLMALGLLAISAGCTKTEAPPANTDGPEASADVPAESPVAELPEKLICGITDFEPMNFKDDDGEWIGFDTEFALLVGEKLGIPVEFQEIDWSNKYLELKSGAINCIWNGFTANASDDGKPRSDEVDFSYSYMLNQQCVVIKADKAADFADIEAVAGKKVAAEKGSAGEEAAKDAAGDAGTVIDVDKQTDALAEVLSGAVDCAVMDILLAKQKVGTGDFANLAIADIEMDSEIYAIGFAKGSALTAAVNAAIKELNDEGKLEELASKYDLENTLLVDLTFKS